MACNYDYRKLRGRIKEKFGTQSEFSKSLDCQRFQSAIS